MVDSFPSKNYEVKGKAAWSMRYNYVYAAPQTPEVTVSPLYDQNGQLNLTVKWMQQVS